MPSPPPRLQRLRRGVAACVLLALAPVAPGSAWSGARAQTAPYLSDLPRLFPTAYANWQKTLPYAVNPTDWLRKLDGVATPLRDVTVAGGRFKFGTVCVPHDCGANIAGVLFTAAQDRVVAVARLNSKGGAPTAMLIGTMSAAEALCVQKLIDDSQLTAC